MTLDRAALDITQPAAVQRILTASGADLVINAAAYTAVDKAEREAAAAFAANRDGPAHLAAACARLGIPLFHLSTDYVFDGTQAGPYREDDVPAPLGIYGLGKWQGEEAVRRALSEHIILRVSWVFGERGHNFVKTILRLAREREQLRVVADQRGCPTYAAAVADVLLSLAGRLARDGALAWGTYHYCGTPPTTWHGFAQAIVAGGRRYEPLQAQEVVAISTADYPTPAPRPANSVLDCTRIAETFGVRPRPWSQGLRTALAALYG
jgi:dTDP-4-dehydrorhamnose reductase